MTGDYVGEHRSALIRGACAARPFRCGFSLLELLLVIALAGLLLALVLTSGQPAVVEQLRATAGLLSADLAYARSLAVSNNSTYKITFSLKKNRYVLEHSGTNPALHTLPKSPFSLPGDSPTKHVVDLDELPRVGPLVHLAAVGAGDPPEATTTVEFGSLGQLTSGRPTTIWLTAGSGNEQRYITLEIDAVTGIVRCGTCSLTPPPASAL